MNIKNVNEIYFSPTGGTQKAVNMLARGFGKTGITIDLCRPDLKETVFGADELCIIGVPAYSGRVPATALERLERLQGQQTPVVLVAVYGNRAIEDTLLELQDLLNQRGFITVAGAAAVAEHSIVRTIAAGRPNTDDAEQLKEFARQIQANLEQIQTPVGVQMPGNRPYREPGIGSMKPAADASCIRCGLCAGQCPTEAIFAQSPEQTDFDRCIACMRCVEVCPLGARKLPQEAMDALKIRLAQLCKGYKDNQLFLSGTAR